MSFSDRQVSYVLCDWFNSYVCMTVGCRKVKSWQRALTAVKEQFKHEAFFLNRKIRNTP